MKILLTTVLVLVWHYSSGQNINLSIAANQEVKESYSANNTGTTIQKIKLTVSYSGAAPAFNLPVVLSDEEITASNSDYKIINNQFTITATEFANNNSPFDIDIFIELTNDDENTDSGDEVFTIDITPDANSVPPASVYRGNVHAGNTAAVTIKEASKETLEFDPYRITIGASFDFEKTVDATLYFDAQMFRPNIKNILDCENFGIGFYGSLYHNRYLSQDSIQTPEKQFNEVIGQGDTVDVVRYNYEIGVNSTIKNVGGEFGLLWGWEKKLDNDSYIANTFILPELSAIHRRVNTTFTYDKINVDTLSQVPHPDTVRRLVEREFSNYRFDEVLFGLGYIGRYHSKKYGEFMLKATTGMAFQKWTTQRDFLWYYSFRFQLIEPKVGINLGGEVRGYYNHTSPYFGVYLSKSFGLKKLTDYSD